MNDTLYKYDVAVSFLDQDEALARQLSDSFEGRLSAFVYSEHQAELGGKDGVEAFSRVFKDEARIVVVLYRVGWGETPWTRVESTAIEERFLKHGHDFLLVVPVSSPKAKPAWFPDIRIWLDLDRLGLTKLSGIIEYRVREKGGEPKQETAVESAARIKRERDAHETKQRFNHTREAVEAATKEAQEVVSQIERLAREVSDPNHGVVLRFGRPNDAPVQLAYKDAANDRQMFSSAQLSDFCIKLLLDALDENKPWQVR